MLLYSERGFFQILEGAPEDVDALMARIATDPRHRAVTVIIREPIARRSFGDWTMGYASISADEIKELSGANDFFQEGHCFSWLDAGRAKRLLTAFKMGSWRSHAAA